MNKKIVPCENQEFLPQEVAESEKAKLDTAQKNLLGTLCFYYLNHSIYAAEHDGWFFKDQKTLFEESNLSPAEGKRVLLKLVFKRLVERASGTNGKCTHYRLNKGIRDLMPQNPELKTEVEDIEKMANEPLEKNSLVESSKDETRLEEKINENVSYAPLEEGATTQEKLVPFSELLELWWDRITKATTVEELEQSRDNFINSVDDRHLCGKKLSCMPGVKELNDYYGDKCGALKYSRSMK